MVLDNGRFLTSELSNIAQMLEEHFRIAMSANRIVVSSLSEWLDSNKSIDPAELEKITKLEEKGDDLKRQIAIELAKANTLMQREDLLRLVHYNDKLVDGAEIAAYHLAEVIGSWAPTGNLKEKISQVGDAVLEIVTEQKEAVRFLSINMETSMTKADEICKIEKRIDVLMRDIFSLLYPAEIEVGILLRFRDFLNVMEDIANFSEDAAITIRSLSLTLNT
jgi:predicted phosphate transport protein (TIGR00153 family)